KRSRTAPVKTSLLYTNTPSFFSSEHQLVGRQQTRRALPAVVGQRACVVMEVGAATEFIAVNAGDAGFIAGEDITAINNGITSIDGDKFGGSTNFHYDTCALANNGGKRPPRLLATHELMF